MGPAHPFSPPEQQLTCDATVADFLPFDHHEELVAAGVLAGGEVPAHVFEPLFQLGNIVGEMTNTDAILESKATIRRNGRKG
jgi:hypothetical protein